MQFCQACGESILYFDEEYETGICSACSELENNNNNGANVNAGTIHPLNFDTTVVRGFSQDVEAFNEEQRLLNTANEDTIITTDDLFDGVPDEDEVEPPPVDDVKVV